MGIDIKKMFSIHNQMTTKEKVKSGIQYFNIFGCFVGGFTINMATYFSWLIIPLLMEDIGGTDFEVGLADAITFGLCGILCPIVGFMLNKKWFPLDDVCRIGFIFQALSTIVIGIYYIEGKDLLPIFFILLFQAFGLAFFWSICEFILSNEIYKHETNKKMSYFSMSWSLGKAIGFLISGPMMTALGNTFALYIASIICLIGWAAFPRMLRNRSHMTRKEADLYRRMKNGEFTVEELKEEIIKERIRVKETKKKKVQKFPYYYMLYYFNELVIHFTVYGTVAVFGNQYILFAEENTITLKGIDENPSTFSSVFLGVIYFSQSAAFFIYGLFHQWQYKPILNIIVQGIIAAISVGMIFLRNGWILVVLAIPIGFISGYDLQASVIYAINAGPKHKGKILGLSEMVGELTCSLCPLFAGLLSTSFKNKKAALIQGIILQVIGMVACLILYIVVLVLEHKTGKKYREEDDEEDDMDEPIDESLSIFSIPSTTEEEESISTDDETKPKDDVVVPIDLINKKDSSESSSLSTSSEEEIVPKEEPVQPVGKDDIVIPKENLKVKGSSDTSTISSLSSSKSTSDE